MPPKPQNARMAKLFSSRTIRTENSDPSIKEGVLNIPEFLSSREYEIKAFEQSQLNTKYASSTRVFQSLPRLLRRRTASHNVKRIPKRLRAKALKEMQNTVNGVPPKKLHLRGRELHRLKLQKRMLMLASRIKELRTLPALEGSNTREKLQALNAQLKEAREGKRRWLNNALGAFDNHAINKLAERPHGNVRYAHRQKEFVWLPTHVWHAKRFHMMKRWGYQIPFSPNQKCFRATSRAAKSGCLSYEALYNCELVARCGSPETVQELIGHITKYAGRAPEWLTKGHRVYQDWIYCKGAKYCAGTVLVCADSLDVLVKVHPSNYPEVFSQILEWGKNKAEVIDCRYAIGEIQLHGPKSLRSISKILHLEKVPGQIQASWKLHLQTSDANIVPAGTTFAFTVKDPRYWKHPVKAPFLKGSINSLIVDSKNYIDPESLAALLSAEGRTQSYKDMSTLKYLGKQFSEHPSLPNVHGASSFPILVYKMPNGNWSVNMPWHWVVPMWSKLVQVKEIKAAGMRQVHQVNFENNVPTFPVDFPFLTEGYREHVLKQKAADIAREKLPLSKRTPMAIEGPLKSGCDWFFLRKWVFGLQCVDKTRKGSAFGEFKDMDRVLNSPDDWALVIAEARDNDGCLEKIEPVPVQLVNKSDQVHRAILDGKFKPDISKFPLLPMKQVSLSFASRGSISDNARIYENVAEPTLQNLIGFVTSGSFNFNAGAPTGIAVIVANYDLEKVKVRNVGCTNFHTGTIKRI